MTIKDLVCEVIVNLSFLGLVFVAIACAYKNKSTVNKKTTNKVNTNQSVPNLMSPPSAKKVKVLLAQQRAREWGKQDKKSLDERKATKEVKQKKTRSKKEKRLAAIARAKKWGEEDMKMLEAKKRGR